jgi:hypothetical protein
MKLQIVNNGKTYLIDGMLTVSIAEESVLFPIEISTDDLYNKIRGRNLDNPLGVLREKQIESSFVVFWDKYKKKEGRHKAYQAWRKLSETDRTNVLSRVDEFVKHHSDIRYRPMASSFLNGRRWEDELPSDKNKIVMTTSNWAERNTW